MFYINVIVLTYNPHNNGVTVREQFLFKLYRAIKFATLNKYRCKVYNPFMDKTSASSTFTSASFPPTNATSLCKCVSTAAGSILPTKYNLIAIAIDQTAACQMLLKLSWLWCRNACCKKIGMACSDMCFHCMYQMWTLQHVWKLMMKTKFLKFSAKSTF